MGNVRFIGCLHLGHDNIAKYRGFNSAKEHDSVLIENWNSVVHKKDIVYILGDVAYDTDKHYSLLDKLKGRKIVVLGNHDLPKHIPSLLKHVESVAGMIHYKKYWLTHAPVHPQELAFANGNIHAHIHHVKQIPYSEIPVNYWDKKSIIKSKSNLKYYNVDAFLINFKPKTIKELTNNN